MKKGEGLMNDCFVDLVFFYCCGRQCVGLSNPWNVADVLLHEIHGVVMVVCAEPYASVPCSENIVRVA